MPIYVGVCVDVVGDVCLCSLPCVQLVLCFSFRTMVESGGAEVKISVSTAVCASTFRGNDLFSHGESVCGYGQGEGEICCWFVIDWLSNMS